MVDDQQHLAATYQLKSDMGSQSTAKMVSTWWQTLHFGLLPSVYQEIGKL